MNYPIFLCGVLLSGAVAIGAQQRSIVPLENQSIDPGVIDRIRLPVANTPSTSVLTNARTSAAAAAAAAQVNERPELRDAMLVDLAAVRARVGAVSDIQVVRDNGATAVPALEPVVPLRRGEFLTVRRDDVEAQTDVADGVTMTSSPTILYTVDAAGRTRELGLVYRSAGLYWQPEQERFAGELLVGILDRENPQASGPLGAAVPVQLLAPPGVLDATNIELSRIGLPFQRVVVDVAVPEDPFPIEFLSQIDPDLPRAGLRVVRPELSLAAPDDIQGFGVGEAEVTISAIGQSLRPGLAITLNVDNGWLAERTVIVDDSGTARTRVRSNWLGAGTLSVVSPSVYQATPRRIAYTFPLRFMLAAALGGMLGAVVLVYMLKRKEGAETRSYAMDWAVGVAIGVGVSTMAYAGMKLPEWLPVPPLLAGEVAPFALSFIAAAAGAGIIHAIVGGVRQPAK